MVSKQGGGVLYIVYKSLGMMMMMMMEVCQFSQGQSGGDAEIQAPPPMTIFARDI